MNHSNDRYNNFQELKTNTKENKDWRVITKNRNHHDILVTAIHGGGIEPGTTELARRISNIGEYDFYTFEGLRSKTMINFTLHLPITMNQSYVICLKQRKTISIHGFSGDDPIVFVGGKDKNVKINC